MQSLKSLMHAPSCSPITSQAPSFALQIVVHLSPSAAQLLAYVPPRHILPYSSTQQYKQLENAAPQIYELTCNPPALFATRYLLTHAKNLLTRSAKLLGTVNRRNFHDFRTHRSNSIQLSLLSPLGGFAAFVMGVVLIPSGPQGWFSALSIGPSWLEIAVFSSHEAVLQPSFPICSSALEIAVQLKAHSPKQSCVFDCLVALKMAA